MARILLAEDDDAYRQTLRRILESGGHDVTEAPDGARALAIFREGDFEVLVTDLHMPQTDGVELLRALRQEGRTVHVVGITGGSMVLPTNVSGTLLEAFGADRVLFKPFRASELLAAVAPAA